MADFATVDEADLQTGPQSSEGLTGNGAGALTKGAYEPVNDNDLVPAGGPAGQTGEFAYKGIPAAAAARFKASSPLANVFGAGVSGFVKGYANDFNALADKDKQTLVEGGYGDYRAGFPGSLLQHAADMFNSGLALTVDGFMALGGGISGATSKIEGQIVREMGGTETEAQRGEREGAFVGMAVQSDIGMFHGLSMLDAAKANAAVPGVYGHAYRFDVTPEGTAKATPLGRLPPEGPESLAQAATVADALHLPPSAAGLIHRTYVETGRPPAEVLMDAKTNHGGVLSDLVAGQVPTVYQGPARALTPEELAAAGKGVTETSPEVAATPAGVSGEGAISSAAPGSPPSVPPEAPTGISKIGKSIEAKAVEDGLTEGFGNTAGYDKITIADQAARTADLINTDLDKARAVIRGEEPLPSGMKGTALITAMEDYIKKNPNADLAYELANSPLVTGTSEAAQEMRLAAERTPDSAAAKLAEIKAAQAKVVTPKVAAARRAAIKDALPEAGKVLLPKEELSWNKFLADIAC